MFFPLEEREIVFRTNGEGAISPFDSYEVSIFSVKKRRMNEKEGNKKIC